MPEPRKPTSTPRETVAEVNMERLLDKEDKMKEELSTKEEVESRTHRERVKDVKSDIIKASEEMAESIKEARMAAMNIDNSDLLAEVLNYLGLAEVKMSELVESLKSDMYE